MGNSMSGGFPMTKTLVINVDHPMIKKLSKSLEINPKIDSKINPKTDLKKSSKSSLSLSKKLKQAILTLHDIALLEQNDLKGQNLQNFTKRIIEGIEKTL